MVSFSTLKSAKAFLCWDEIPDLSIQLVPVQKNTAWYYPPNNPFHSIVVYYDTDSSDLSNVLFFLFHEAGHVLQWLAYKKDDNLAEFNKMLAIDKGEHKVAFEANAWDLGKKLLERFLLIEKIDLLLLSDYELFAENSKTTYGQAIK